MTAYKCGPVESMDKNALKYKIQINSPLVIENKSMMPLKVYEIDDPNTPDEDEKLSSEIPPSMSDTLLQLDISDLNKSYFKF